MLPSVKIGRRAQLKRQNVVIDHGVTIPEGLVVGEDPELDATALPSHRKRHSPDHADDDRQAGYLTYESSFGFVRSLPTDQDRGLADVTGALPIALDTYGVENRRP